MADEIMASEFKIGSCKSDILVYMVMQLVIFLEFIYLYPNTMLVH